MGNEFFFYDLRQWFERLPHYFRAIDYPPNADAEKGCLSRRFPK